MPPLLLSAAGFNKWLAALSRAEEPWLCFAGSAPEPELLHMEGVDAAQEAAEEAELQALDRAERDQGEQQEDTEECYFCDGEACIADRATGGDEEPEPIRGPRFRCTRGEAIDLCERCWRLLGSGENAGGYVRFEEGEGSDEERTSPPAPYGRKESTKDVWERIRNWDAPRHYPRDPPPPPRPAVNGWSSDEAEAALAEYDAKPAVKKQRR